MFLRNYVGLALVAAGPLGCVVVTQSVIPAASGLTSPAKPSTCHIDFFWTTPDRPYQELAAVSLTAAVASGGIGPGYDAFREALRVKSCELGGDAVVVLRPFSASEGIVVKYRDVPGGPLLPPPPGARE